MFVVAIADLDRAIDEEAPFLSQILGTSPYDVRLALNGTPPAVVLRTPSRRVAEQALADLRARRCAALMVPLDEVVPLGRMIAVRRFVVDDEGLLATESGPKLAWRDVAALIRVSTTSTVERTVVQREVRNTARGMPVTVDEERTRLERDHDQLVCLFPRTNATPWVLRAREARYLGLGPALRATAHENFLATVTMLRARAPHAAYDERFALHPLTRHNTAQARGALPPTHTIVDAGIDLPVHLLARWLIEPSGGPYRDARE